MSGLEVTRGRPVLTLCYQVETTEETRPAWRCDMLGRLRRKIGGWLLGTTPDAC